MEIKKKLKEKDGSTVIDVAILFFVGMLLFSAAFEYIRVQIIAYNIKESFENAVRTVAIENYNEIYAGLREGKEIGGQYEGGAEGGGDSTEEPEWVAINDYGNVSDELAELLGREDLETGAECYIRDIETKVQDATDSSEYKVTGNLVVIVPIHLIGIPAQAKVPIQVEYVYKKMY
ncbi:hypothetical protein [Anaeromicropila populeti]|uniref:Uncharacterized protein n=1 Tax=Anaeromicropila populeti TaxID=37658 RepID=A0A1I6JFT1_9FIRM|nr:hypothetical protein [Anaeromicropila populeti]SFR77744.1 hypothetical protein SAMN05661086_01642 [Anaeromicropila populeti]